MRGAGWRSARRTGVAALALLGATTGTALILARTYHLGTAATLVAILGGLPGLYLAWVSYRVAQHEADKAGSLAEIADELAVLLQSQWAHLATPQAGRKTHMNMS